MKHFGIKGYLLACETKRGFDVFVSFFDRLTKLVYDEDPEELEKESPELLTLKFVIAVFLDCVLSGSPYTMQWLEYGRKRFPEFP